MKRAPAPLHTADGARAAPTAARLRTPFALLGIRTENGKLTGVDYLPQSERAQRPVDAFTAEVVAEIGRYLADPQHRFALPLDPAGARIAGRSRRRGKCGRWVIICMRLAIL